MNDFFQQGPELGNQYEADNVLNSYLKRVLPPNVLNEIESDLRNLGQRVVSDILEMAEDAEKNEPELIQFDAWGRRIDEIKTAQGWKDLDKVSAEEGMISIGYERKYEEYSRIYQFVKLYLFNPSSAIYTCPLAMTDGATRLIEVYGDDELKNNAYKHLTSRNKDDFWTSGQWMTEKTGGSDVSGTQTIARLENGEYRLYGIKWFTSATTSQMAMTLARIEDENGNIIEGSKGLSLFYLEIRDENGKLNNIEIHRLKDKLGTKSLPTAELSLKGTKAKLVGGVGDGVKKMSTLFNITRIYNANSAVAFMRRANALMRDYAEKRVAFNKKLSEHPLHLQTLSELETEFHSAFFSLFYTVELLGKEECNKSTEEESRVLRLLTPLIKLYTAKQSINTASELLESFGGAGYVENTGLPKFLRDAQVLSIWEGTTNILSLDVLRSIEKEKTFQPFIGNLKNRIEKIDFPKLLKSKEILTNELNKFLDYSNKYFSSDINLIQTGARNFSYTLFKLFSSSLMLEHAQWSAIHENNEKFIISVNRWINKGLTSLLLNLDNEYLEQTKSLALNEKTDVIG